MKKMVFVPVTRFPTPCASLPISLDKFVVQVPLLVPQISCVYPYFLPVVGSSTPWKDTAPSRTVSTVWLACACERRGYLWGGLFAGGSTIGGGSGGLGGTGYSTLGGAWGSVLCCSLGSCTVARVRLGGGVGFGGCTPFAAKMLASCRMASMVWVLNQEKGAAGAGFSRPSTRRLYASVAALAEDMDGMAPLWGKTGQFW